MRSPTTTQRPSQEAELAAIAAKAKAKRIARRAFLKAERDAKNNPEFVYMCQFSGNALGNDDPQRHRILKWLKTCFHVSQAPGPDARRTRCPTWSFRFQSPVSFRNIRVAWHTALHLQHAARMSDVPQDKLEWAAWSFEPFTPDELVWCEEQWAKLLDLAGQCHRAWQSGKSARDAEARERSLSTASDRVKDAMTVLGVGPGHTPEELRRRHRKAALEHHPDRGGDPSKFVEFQAAYEALRLGV